MGKARDGDSLSLILVLLMMAEVGGELHTIDIIAIPLFTDSNYSETSKLV